MDGEPKEICLEYLLGLCRGLKLFTFGWSICFRIHTCDSCHCEIITVRINTSRSYEIATHITKQNIVALIGHLEKVRCSAQEFDLSALRSC